MSAIPNQRLTEQAVSPYPIHVIGSHGTELFVLNKNAKTVNTQDPYLFYTAGDGTLVIPVGNPGHRLLDLFLISDFGAGAIPSPVYTTACIVRLFGRVRGKERHQTLYPSQVLSSSFDPLGHSSIGGGYFIPLLDPASSDPALTFPTAGHVFKDTTTGSSRRFAITRGRFVDVEGVDTILALVATAAGTTAVSTMLMGRFGS
jgi:hypothetical protein